MRSFLLLSFLLIAVGASAQGGLAPTFPDSVISEDATQFRRRIEALARNGRGDQAVAMLEARQKAGMLDEILARRLARFYHSAQRWDELESLVLDPVDGILVELDASNLRLLADARFAQGRNDDARAALDAMLEIDPGDVSLIRLVATLYMNRDQGERAIAILLEGRERIERPFEFAQLLGRLYAEKGDAVKSAEEFALVVANSPLNITVVRGQVMDLLLNHPDQATAMKAAVDAVARAYPNVAAVRILTAELSLQIGDQAEAWRQLTPLLEQPAMAQELLRMSIAGLSESRLPGIDVLHALRRLQLSARIASGLLGNESLPPALEPRVHDTLVRCLLTMLESKGFDLVESEERDELLDDARLAILDMQRRFPGNRLTSAALLKLAEVYIDALDRPADGARMFRSLVDDPNTARADVLVARMGLARAYIASADTSAARELLTEIGLDQSEPKHQGRAQYHLAMLDFMGGNLDTAEERFRAVALQNPRADYTNDALDLAIVINAEEFTGAANEIGLRDYGRALYFRAINDTDSMFVVLESVASGTQGPVREQSRLDLAEFKRDQGQYSAALTWTEKIIADAPETRWAADALGLRAEVLVKLGRTLQALETYERLVLDHEDYVHIDQVRDRIAELRAAPAEGELP